MHSSIKLLIKHQNFILPCVVFLVALFFRVYQLPDIPFGLNNDAAWEGSAALDILRGNVWEYVPYAAEGWRGEGIIRIVVAFLMFLIGNDPIVIRLATVLLGLGLIIPLYMLISMLFDKRTAFVTTFLVAISGWHITMSKTGWRAICVPFFATLAVYFLSKGIRTNKRLSFFLSGIFVSLGTFYTYDGGRILPLLFLAWLSVLVFSEKTFFKKQFSNLLLFLSGGIITAFPMGIYMLTNWQNFSGRSDFLFVGHRIQEAGNFSPLWENIVSSLLIFNVDANGNDFFLTEPLLDNPLGLFLPIGFVFSVYKMLVTKDTRYVLMLIWFVVSMIPGLVSIPNGNRNIGTIPTVYFFTGVGLLFVANTVARLFSRFQSRVSVGITCLLLLIGMYITFSLYLGPQRREQFGFYPETRIATNFIQTLPSFYKIYLTDNYPRELLTYYLYRGGDPFLKHYTWLENTDMFFDVLSENPKSQKAFVMFDTIENEAVANTMLRQVPGSRKMKVGYTHKGVKRSAALIVLTQ